MEFEGVGLIPYEAPSPDLKAFFEVKGITFFRNLVRSIPSKVITKEIVAQYAAKAVDTITDPKEQKEASQKLIAFYEFCILFGRERINEEEYIEEYIKMVYGDIASRKKALEWQMDTVRFLFDPIDTNHNGVIEFDEFTKWYEMYGLDNQTAKDVFDAIDMNGDGVISQMEWAYGLTSFHMQCGPESPFKLWYGPLVEL